MKKKVLFSLLILSFHLPIYSQMLFTENLTLDIDSTKTIQGSLLPVVDFKTESENILTIKNTANLNILINSRRELKSSRRFYSNSPTSSITFPSFWEHFSETFMFQVSIFLLFSITEKRSSQPENYCCERTVFLLPW